MRYMGRMGSCGVRRRARNRVLTGALAGMLGAAALATTITPAASGATAAPPDDPIYLVTLDGPGTAGNRGPVPVWMQRATMLRTQSDLLDGVDAEAVYQWTTALDGFAARLNAGQVEVLRRDPRVVQVERNSVRPLAGSPGAGAGLPGAHAVRGGAGTVVGLVDTGIWPDSSLFASVPGLGRAPRGFHGACSVAEDWGGEDCNRKLVGARWFVTGFGEDDLRSSSSLSPRDDNGHGTQMASIAAGNPGVTVAVPGQRLGQYGGVAPQARIAVYKACWSAPDPSGDGCATADLVTAIDRATADGVDVLNLSVGGPSTVDTVERALLGAAEKGIVVVGAAGNRGSTAYAAHSSPWVTSVGGTTGALRVGSVRLPDGSALEGAMTSSRGAGPARLVLGVKVPADGASQAAARICRPGSLDASRTEGAIVLCERGGIGRVEKSAAVRQADGLGMVLANTDAGRVESDLHSVPTVHLTRDAATSLRQWHARHPAARVTLVPRGVSAPAPRVTPWSSTGDPTGSFVKPDLVGPAVGILGAVPPGVRSIRWDFVTGTSAATAWTSGLALRLLGEHPWSAAEVRSALVTTAASVSGGSSGLSEGAGRPRVDAAERTGVAYLVRPGDYRAWLDGDLHRHLNAPSVLLSGDRSLAVRRVTNVGGRPQTFTASVTGFAEHTVTVRPSTLHLRPGRSATFRIRVTGAGRAVPLDDGWLTWSAPDGTEDRIPVVLTR
jgi:minor extracellular serine protease Vpr